MSHNALTALAKSLPASVPFVGPETQERALGRAFSARLGANESQFGPSPRAIEAMAQAAQEVWQYGDPENHDLKQALAAHHNIDPGHITLGEGIDGLLLTLTRLTIASGDAILTSDGAYPTFNYHAAGNGGTLHMVPYLDDHEDPRGLVEQARRLGAKLVYFANPDNPMGSWHSADTVQELIDNLPKSSLLVLDEAYIELAPNGTAPDLRPETDNVTRLRTFSKAYGMAGARVGYAIGPKSLISAFDKLRNHFGLSRISQAGALAALKDQAYVDGIKQKVAKSRETLAQIAQDNGLIALPSATNFVTIDCGRDGDFARAVLEQMIARAVFIRMPFVAPMNRCIRISCGDEAAMDLVAKALPEAMKAARSA
ncbi:pyridoxal phosphate-dependent aminotransferase [Planktomarina temperata]|nr:pyridoxal phosphate-dependent aminotransferase [Planktomarina temperata]MDA7449230.1 pyridoxal phosphate-dependent aminotransferase [Planktomarina temperata]